MTIVLCSRNKRRNLVKHMLVIWGFGLACNGSIVVHIVSLHCEFGDVWGLVWYGYGSFWSIFSDCTKSEIHIFFNLNRAIKGGKWEKFNWKCGIGDMVQLSYPKLRSRH